MSHRYVDSGTDFCQLVECARYLLWTVPGFLYHVYPIFCNVFCFPTSSNIIKHVKLSIYYTWLDQSPPNLWLFQMQCIVQKIDIDSNIKCLKFRIGVIPWLILSNGAVPPFFTRPKEMWNTASNWSKDLDTNPFEQLHN